MSVVAEEIPQINSLQINHPSEKHHLETELSNLEKLEPDISNVIPIGSDIKFHNNIKLDIHKYCVKEETKKGKDTFELNPNDEIKITEINYFGGTKFHGTIKFEAWDYIFQMTFEDFLEIFGKSLEKSNKRDKFAEYKQGLEKFDYQSLINLRNKLKAKEEIPRTQEGLGRKIYIILYKATH